MIQDEAIKVGIRKALCTKVFSLLDSKLELFIDLDNTDSDTKWQRSSIHCKWGKQKEFQLDVFEVFWTGSELNILWNHGIFGPKKEINVKRVQKYLKSIGFVAVEDIGFNPSEIEDLKFRGSYDGLIEEFKSDLDFTVELF